MNHGCETCLRLERGKRDEAEQRAKVLALGLAFAQRKRAEAERIATRSSE